MRAWAVVLMGCIGCTAQAPPHMAPRPESTAGTIADATILGTALVVAEKVGIPRMQAEENLTWQSGQLTELTRLFAKPGRYNEALQLIHDLDTPDCVKAPGLTRGERTMAAGEQAADLRIGMGDLGVVERLVPAPISFRRDSGDRELPDRGACPLRGTDR